MAGVASSLAGIVVPLGLAVSLLALCSCETQSVDPLEKTQPRDAKTLHAIMRPMREPKGGPVVVFCDNLTVDLSRELYITDVMKKFTNAYHTQKRDERSRPVQETFKNSSGGTSSPLEFRIHAVRFIVIKSAKFRIHARGKARFDLEAKGHVQILETGTEGPRDVPTLQIREGSWKEK